MATYSLSSRNQFRSPSGAVGEAPDGPGGIAALRDDVDAFLGVGGAEYVASSAAMNAIPTARRFVGKLIYRADLDTVFRWVGVGGTALAGNDSTHGWQAWTKAPTPFTPTWSAGMAAATPLTQVALWGITDGRTWVDLNCIATAASWGANADLTLTLPSSVVAQASAGTGTFAPAGSSTSGTMLPLVAYTVGTIGASGTGVRVRVPRIGGSTVPANPTLTTLFTAVGAGAANDQIVLSIAAPSALVA